jgi:SpoVK/Ycf46/Vps4 family AAA+-type ATPase
LTRCRGFKLIEVDLPTYEERKAFIHFLEDLAKEGNTDFGELEEGLDSEALARLTAGMALTGIESCYRASAKFKKPITREQIRTVKANELRNLARDLLDVSEPQEGFEGVAGLVSIKSYFHEIIPQIKAGRPGVPQAFLLQGVPGCGKSHLVKALSKEIGWPLLELRNVRSPFVGQSEMNLDHVIRVVEQLQPAILFFDEIDQTLGQRGTGASGDSGTSERILARIFSWLGSLHLRGRLIFIGATNRPDILDPALLDRFGVSIPFLKPGIEEIKELIPLLMERFDRRFIEISLDEIAGILKDMFLTGRDIQEILIQAGLRADREMRQIGSEIKKDHLLQSIHDHISREDVIEMEFMTLISLSICSSQALLPWNSIDGIRDSGGIPEGLIEKGIVSNKGRLNRGKLQELISELKQIRFREKYTR